MQTTRALVGKNNQTERKKTIDDTAQPPQDYMHAMAANRRRCQSTTKNADKSKSQRWISLPVMKQKGKCSTNETKDTGNNINRAEIK